MNWVVNSQETLQPFIRLKTSPTIWRKAAIIIAFRIKIGKPMKRMNMKQWNTDNRSHSISQRVQHLLSSAVNTMGIFRRQQLHAAHGIGVEAKVGSKPSKSESAGFPSIPHVF